MRTFPSLPIFIVIITLTYLGNCSALTEKEAVDEDGVCVVDGQFKQDCNTCFCKIGKMPGCTYKMCPPSTPSTANEEKDEKLTEKDALDENGYCKINGHFKRACNSCSCDIGSKPGCTRKRCPPA